MRMRKMRMPNMLILLSLDGSSPSGISNRELVIANWPWLMEGNPAALPSEER